MTPSCDAVGQRDDHPICVRAMRTLSEVIGKLFPPPQTTAEQLRKLLERQDDECVAFTRAATSRRTGTRVNLNEVIR